MKSKSLFQHGFAMVRNLCVSGIFISMFFFSLPACTKVPGLNVPAPATDTTEFNYSVHFSYRDTAAVGRPGQLYTDSADFDLQIEIEPEAGTSTWKMAVASISKIRNYAPTVDPFTLAYPIDAGFQDTWTFLPDAVGMYDITSVEIANPDLTGDGQIQLSFVNNEGITPSFSLQRDPGGYTGTVGGIRLAGGQVIATPGFLKLSAITQEIDDAVAGFSFTFMPKS